jgi:hypothetical protein
MGLRGKKSFEQWCIENNRQDVLNRWDYNLNDCKPNEITYGINKKCYFKCPRGIHKSELKQINSFTSGHEGSIKCNQCNSIAQWGIDNICEDFLNKYWDFEMNTINPFEIDKSSNKKVYIKCQEKDYHKNYKISPSHFIQNKRCPYCNSNSGKIHLLDSLGALHPEVLRIWSDKNKKSPYEYAPKSNKEIWWKCPDGKHKDYKRSITSSNRMCNFRCPNCIKERDESFLQEKVRLYLEKLNYTILFEHDCNILPINPKIKNTNNTMPFDNEIVELKLIIEVHGKQHYQICHWHKSTSKKHNTTPEYELHYQKLKDRYKRIFAKIRGYFYLEIPYWTDDKEETWKKLIDDKITLILKSKKILYVKFY